MTDTELPKLPDGWEWTGDSQGYRALTNGVAVAMAGGSICVVTTIVADDFSAAFIPPEVLIAVLRANGYSLTS